MNGLYIRKLGLEEFGTLVKPILERDLPSIIKRPLDIDYVNQILPLIQERAKTLDEVVQLSDFFFLEELQYDSNLLLGDGLDSGSAVTAITITLKELEKKATTWDATVLEDILRPLTIELGLSTRKYFGLLRTATTGKIAAPPLFQTMAILGKETSFKRLIAAMDKLHGLNKD
jgi:glutamyl-tRNA synthetase